MNAIELKHPLVEHKLAILRDKKTGTKEFRELIGELSTILCYEAMKDAKLDDVQIETPICKTSAFESFYSSLKSSERIIASSSCLVLALFAFCKISSR